MHINVIARPEDRRRLCLILIKIAQFSNLPLFPYFQDYEIVSFVKKAQKLFCMSQVIGHVFASFCQYLGLPECRCGDRRAFFTSSTLPEDSHLRR